MKAKDAEIERLREIVNRQAEVIKMANRLAVQCEEHLAKARLEIASLRADFREAGILR